MIIFRTKHNKTTWHVPAYPAPVAKIHLHSDIWQRLTKTWYSISRRMLRSLWNPSVTLQKEMCEAPAEPEKQSSLAYIVCVCACFLLFSILLKRNKSDYKKSWFPSFPSTTERYSKVDKTQGLVFQYFLVVTSHARVVPPRRHWHEELFNCRPWTWKTMAVQRILGDQMHDQPWTESATSRLFRAWHLSMGHTVGIPICFSAHESYGWGDEFLLSLFICRTQNYNSKHGQLEDKKWSIEKKSHLCDSFGTFFLATAIAFSVHRAARTLSWPWSWHVFFLGVVAFQNFLQVDLLQRILQTVMRCTDQSVEHWSKTVTWNPLSVTSKFNDWCIQFLIAISFAPLSFPTNKKRGGTSCK